MKKCLICAMIASLALNLSACGEVDTSKGQDTVTTGEVSQENQDLGQQGNEKSEAGTQGVDAGESGNQNASVVEDAAANSQVGAENADATQESTEEVKELSFEERNGSFTDEDELTAEDKLFLKQTILKAWQELDYETLRFYEESSSQYVDIVERVFTADPEGARVWKEICKSSIMGTTNQNTLHFCRG